METHKNHPNVINLFILVISISNADFLEKTVEQFTVHLLSLILTML